MTTTHLKIAKLGDANEVDLLERALKAMPGVHSARIDSSANEAVVEHDNVATDELTAAVKSLGYVAIPE